MTQPPSASRLCWLSSCNGRVWLSVWGTPTTQSRKRQSPCSTATALLVRFKVSPTLFLIALNSQGIHRGVQKEESGHHLYSKRAEKAPKPCLNTVTKTLYILVLGNVFEYTPLCNKRENKGNPKLGLDLKFLVQKKARREHLLCSLFLWWWCASPNGHL